MKARGATSDAVLYDNKGLTIFHPPLADLPYIIAYIFLDIKEDYMAKFTWLSSVVVASLSAWLQAAPVGAVLYRENSPVHYARFNVPANATHHYFGFLEGPAWENNYCAFRVYIDSDNRNALDFIGKYKPAAILSHFDDPSVDEHTNFSWGTDCFSVSSSMGLGPFRLYYNNQWINPQLGKNIDSMVITILDSSTQTPKVSIAYYGWNIGSGAKVTVTWIMNTTFAERATHCEVTINGEYTGKVVVGMINNNKRNHPVTIIKDSTKALLASIGKQGAVGEGFTDTLLLAMFAERSYFSAYAENDLNIGMVLTPDADKKVKWSIAYCWAKETSPIFRDPDWQNKLFPQTNIRINNKRVSSSPVTSTSHQIMTGQYETFSLLGKKLNACSMTNTAGTRLPYGLYFVRDRNGGLVKRVNSVLQ